jgi:replicative DNA helicase
VIEIEQRYDKQAELALLSACLYSKPARMKARKIVVGSDFYQPAHEAIWNAISRLDHHDRLVDISTIRALLVSDKLALQALGEVVIAGGVAAGAADYASIIRAWSTRRRIEETARAALQEAQNLDANPVGLAASIANRFVGIRDMGVDEEPAAVTVTELLSQVDDEPEWLIPGLLERRDRFMLTGEEGLGKSHLLRQFAIHAAAGLNPFDSLQHFEPVRSLIVDCENTWSQVRRKIRPAVDWVRKTAAPDPSERVMVECSTRLDVTRDKDLSKIHQLLDATEPDLVVIGPLYRLTTKAIQTDDEAAPVLAALDTIRDRGCALLMEAHAGHAIGKGGVRDLRPRGSSALLGWPEFGYGMRSIGAEGFADLVQWRGPREDRDWPSRLRKADGFRWQPHGEMYGLNGGAIA